MQAFINEFVRIPEPLVRRAPWSCLFGNRKSCWIVFFWLVRSPASHWHMGLCCTKSIRVRAPVMLHRLWPHDLTGPSGEPAAVSDARQLRIDRGGILWSAGSASRSGRSVGPAPARRVL